MEARGWAHSLLQHPTAAQTAGSPKPHTGLATPPAVSRSQFARCPLVTRMRNHKCLRETSQLPHTWSLLTQTLGLTNARHRCGETATGGQARASLTSLQFWQLGAGGRGGAGSAGCDPGKGGGDVPSSVFRILYNPRNLKCLTN